ncbi:hypothetical protein D6D21_04532 [Aureobasidium pullulans]|uniref:C2H2-type domain-containing protein n=1 Tax=Aureobasidium pullulans TaxID=5580 RepID=A0AB74J1A5_AURPU|nr:hypothetical protein D6D21_04532 [Aureobasidium pullulans]
MPSKTSSHPRRRPGNPSTTDALIDSFVGLSIQKGTTFHSPSSNKSELFNPLDVTARSMTTRSVTSPKALEDLLIGAGERRAADLLAKVDQVIADNSSAAALGKLLSEPEALPHPRCILDKTGLQGIAEERRDSPNNAYDSGLGSSIADSDEFDTKKTSTASKDSTLKRSPSSTSSSYADEHLSEFACEQIHKYIVKPILRQQSLKDFHPLVRGVPRRIGSREITTLRDLEKTLIFLAPDYSRSPSSYLNFCETYIDCLHATVDIVHESDHCSPSDRPYTNNYFIDLVGQIRRYAQIVASTRAKKERGEDLDEMDVTSLLSDEVLRLRGGVTHNTPAQLVRHRAGKDISLLDGAVLSSFPTDHSVLSSKRPIMEDSLNDDVERSMARRRKGEPVKTYDCGFDGCDKIFRRPCDRTKHMKSHERPWKCPHTDCKYHDEGWPTEKECERHVNDKHAESPIMYACYWSTVNNCPYQSKRLSNCKSHMEKAHGWDYVRSKTTVKNGKTKAKPGQKEPVQQPIKLIGGIAANASTPSTSSASASTSTTPYMQTEQYPVTDLSTVLTSPQDFSVPSMGQGIMTPFESPFNMAMDFQPEFADHFNFDWTSAFTPAVNNPLYTPSLVDDRRQSHDSSATNTVPNSTLLQGETSFDDAFNPPTPEDSPPFVANDGFKLDPGYQAGPSDYISDQSLLFSPPQFLVNGADPTLSAPQPMTTQGFIGDATLDMEMDNDDFDMSQYLPSSNNDALFPSNNDYGLGAQFDEQPLFASTSINNSGSSKENPYAVFFPELQQ